MIFQFELTNNDGQTLHCKELSNPIDAAPYTAGASARTAF